jgi:hypothetical protein
MQKINIGLATFGRTFNLTSPDETQPGSEIKASGIEGNVRLGYKFLN